MKTKPTQHSVKELRSIGIQPDAIVCRSDRPITDAIKRKIALFCDIDHKAVISAVNADTIYAVPLILNREGLDEIVVKQLKLKCKDANLNEWRDLIDRIRNIRLKLRIAIVGKYIVLPDAYMSVVEALTHGGFTHNRNVEISWVDAETLEPKEVEKKLSKMDGILVPGGFGIRGIEGKISAISYARKKRIPFLGICLGMQCAVVEFARHVIGWKNANSSEFDSDTPYPVIDLLPEQKGIKNMGGTMRLGLYDCKLAPASEAHAAYGKELVQERHRHRYEVNNKFREDFAAKGMLFSGLSPDGILIEIIEIPEHPWFVASQFHPEFKSRPDRPHPLFREFIGAALEYRRKKEREKSESSIIS